MFSLVGRMWPAHLESKGQFNPLEAFKDSDRHKIILQRQQRDSRRSSGTWKLSWTCSASGSFMRAEGGSPAPGPSEADVVSIQEQVSHSQAETSGWFFTLNHSKMKRQNAERLHFWISAPCPPADGAISSLIAGHWQETEPADLKKWLTCWPLGGTEEDISGSRPRWRRTEAAVNQTGRERPMKWF